MRNLLSDTSISKIFTGMVLFFAGFFILLSIVVLGSLSSSKSKIETLYGVGIDHSKMIFEANAIQLHAKNTLLFYFGGENLDTLSNEHHQDKILKVEQRLARAIKVLNDIDKTTHFSSDHKFVKSVEHAISKEVELISSHLSVLKNTGHENFRKLIANNDSQNQLDELMNQYTLFLDDHNKALMADFEGKHFIFKVITALLIAASLIFLVMTRIFLNILVLKPLSEAGKNMQHLASADLSRKIQSSGNNEIGQLIKSMISMQDNLLKIVHSLREGSEIIANESTDVNNGSQDFLIRTEQQAASLEETASSMEEMTATVKQNADNSRNASALARDASSTVEKGKNVVAKVVHTMSGIADSSQKISHIIGVIDGIAFQTNILALNASVEAARAGEQGRGFAVVAGEVRTLAGRSADAAREIKALIQDSTNKVSEGSELVEQAGKTMDEMVNAVNRVTDIIDEISCASQEQSAGVAQINEAIAQMDKVTQENASLVYSKVQSSEALRNASIKLEEAVSAFRMNSYDNPKIKKTKEKPESKSKTLSVTTPAATVQPTKPKETGTANPLPSFIIEEKPRAKETAKDDKRPTAQSSDTGDWSSF